MVSPGHRVRLLLAELQLDQNELAERLGVARQTINYIVNGRQPISRDMAGKLARLSGHTPGYWLQFEFEEARSDPAPSVGSSLLNDEEIRQGVRDGTFTITPFNTDLVQPASLDLTIGDLVMRSGASAHRLSEGRPYELGPGEVVNLRTRETLGFPDDYVGRVGSMAGVSRFGIFTALGLQVDPGFHGELEFCLFNAGARSYPLALGAPIISLEIMRLARAHSRAKVVVPHDRNDVAKHFDSFSRALLRKWLASRVRTERKDDRHAASIEGLGAEIRAESEEDAIEGKVATELAAFQSACANSGLDDAKASYLGYFTQHAGRFYLNRDEVRGLASILGFKIEGNVILLRDGQFVPLPQAPGEVALETIAAEFGDTVQSLILALAQSKVDARDAVVAAFPAQVSKISRV